MSDKTLNPITFSTGLSPLPDIGELSYNGAVFGPLLETSVSWSPVQDQAGRTIKWIEGTIEVHGIVTMQPGQTTSDTSMLALRQALDQDGGILIYSGRGFGSVSVNQNTGAGKGMTSFTDLNWGPKPETIEFQPLGAGRGAMVRWRVKTWISELPSIGRNVIQFSESTTLTYDEEGYSGLAIRGILEIGMTRIPVSSRDVPDSADRLRQQWLDLIANSFDLTRYRVTRRSFEVSADKRVMNWEFIADELPPMGLPVGATAAHGSFRFQPMKKGAGLMYWLCSLRCTYTIRKDWPRRTAWLHFTTMLAFRMAQTIRFPVPQINNNANSQQNPVVAAIQGFLTGGVIVARQQQTNAQRDLTNSQIAQHQGRAILISLSGEEGLYLDSKSATFEAQFTIVQPLSNILVGSGFWRYVGNDIDPTTFPGNISIGTAGATIAQFWATRMRDIEGWKSWETGQLDPNQDVIVDFGGGGPT